MSAACLQAALQPSEDPPDPELDRALTGWIVLAEACHDLHLIRKIAEKALSSA